MRRIATWTLGLALCLSGGVARAQARTVVLGVEAVDVPADRAASVHDALRTQVKQSPSFKLVLGKSIDEVKLVFGCNDEAPDCMARAGRSMNAAKLVWGAVKKAAGGVRVTIKLLDVAGARLDRTVSEIVAAADLAGDGARGVVSRLTHAFFPSGYGSIKITTNGGDGAVVMLGPRAVGTVDASGLTVNDIAPGTYELKITRKGYRPWTQQVTVIAGQTVEVEAALEEGAAEVPPPATQAADPTTETPGSGWKIAFWTSAGLTVGMAGGILAGGLLVKARQDDKNREIGAYRDASGVKTAFRGEDVCDDAAQLLKGLAADTKGYANVQGIVNACSGGRTFAVMTNVFVGLTVAAAIASGFFYYKAYIAAPKAEPHSKPATEAVARRWLLTPTAGPRGGGLGFLMEF